MKNASEIKVGDILYDLRLDYPENMVVTRTDMCGSIYADGGYGPRSIGDIRKLNECLECGMIEILEEPKESYGNVIEFDNNKYTVSKMVTVGMTETERGTKEINRVVKVDSDSNYSYIKESNRYGTIARYAIPVQNILKSKDFEEIFKKSKYDFFEYTTRYINMCAIGSKNTVLITSNSDSQAMVSMIILAYSKECYDLTVVNKDSGESFGINY